MKNKKLIYWIIQFVSWGAFCIMVAITIVLQGTGSIYTPFKLLNLYIVLILATNTIRLVLIKRNWLNLKITALIPRTLLLILILSTLLILITNVLVNHLLFNEILKSSFEFFINVLLSAMFLALWTAVYLAFHFVQKSNLQEMNNLKLQTKQTMNELMTLRNQLNPHFLFNSLNNIRALIEIDPPTAKSCITTLSSLLRSSLNLSKKTLITLQEEIQLVKEFLTLEKIRYEERLNYKINNEITDLVYIPAFIIQSMVENAIKHGISKLSDGGEILVQTSYVEDCLILLVTNTGKYQDIKKNAINSIGIGIANTQRRLELIYAENAGFEIKNEDGIVKAKVWIKKEHLKQFNNESSYN